MRDGDVPSQVKTLKTALNLSTDTKPVLCQTVNPEDFTSFMCSLHPSDAQSQGVKVSPFTVPSALQRTIIHAIVSILHKRKSTGPDKVRPEMIKLQLDQFVE